NYIEFMVVKTIGLDPGSKYGIKYGATAPIENLWHFHVSLTEIYNTFMLIVKDINPLVGYIAHPLDLCYTSREKKQERRKNTVEAYRMLFEKGCNWLTISAKRRPSIQPKPNYKICIERSDRACHHICIPCNYGAPDETVGFMKFRIQSRENIPIEEQCLCYNGRPLARDHLTLKESGVQQNSVLTLHHKKVKVSMVEEQIRKDIESKIMEDFGSLPWEH
uniref:Ubiquitin-like domain-containing protein n=1 Tax=Clytia hemisphaerica TaxID=252671 RepID=A0A7M5WWA1_9CNID